MNTNPWFTRVVLATVRASDAVDRETEESKQKDPSAVRSRASVSMEHEVHEEHEAVY